MSKRHPSPVSPPAPEIRAAQRWNIVWVVPILAILLGGWMIYRGLASRGPTASVQFETADGISAGKTEVRCRSVRVGLVTEVKLAEDLQSVLIVMEMDPEARRLLREDSRFWVVRPRLTTTEISGVGTLITGAYIELDPGTGPQGANRFVGLENPPATSSSIPGRRLVLTAEEGGSLGPGSPVYHRGFEVGRIESRRLDVEGRKVVYDAFIFEEYSSLVRENSRFWNTSGIDVSAGTDGFRVRTPSFQAMLSGGVSFAVPEPHEPGNPCSDGTTFAIHPDEESASRSSFDPKYRFLLLFEQSVRGLERDAPVEFRGIPIGRVAGVSFDYHNDRSDPRVPVLIEIDPAMVRTRPDQPSGEFEGDALREAVAKGLRASLKTGSLLTGALFVDLDFAPEAAPAEIGQSGEYITLPTISSGLAQLEAKVTALLDKWQAMPLDDILITLQKTGEEATLTLAEARKTMAEFEATAAAARATLESTEFRELPEELQTTLQELQKSLASLGPDSAIQGDMQRTLEELRASLRAVKTLTNTIDEKPNSLFFGRPSSGNPQPRAPSGKR